MNKSFLKSIIILSLFSFISCQDAPTFDYDPQYVVEGYLKVGDPINNIKFMVSQSVTDTFKYKNSAVSDAEVVIYVENKPIKLNYRENQDVGEYFYNDTTLKVTSGVTYKLEIKTKSGKIITSQTTAPNSINWVKAPFEEYQFPKDTINLPAPDSFAIEWTRPTDIKEMIIEGKCLDTLNYGKYLPNSTNELNRRITTKFNDTRFEYDYSRWGFINTNKSPLSWYIFKWYGKYELKIIACDNNIINWLKQTQWSGQNPESQPTLSNIKGGLGVFGSMYVLSKECFVKKNQP